MRPIRAILDWSARSVRALSVLAGPEAIRDGAALERFLSSRAAYVSQSALYGYLKTRMGTRFRDYFEDDVFAEAIRSARTQVFAACLSDLTVHAVAASGQGRAEYAAARFDAALRAALDEAGEADDPAPHVAAFLKRVQAIDWSSQSSAPKPFALAAAALAKHAPVVDSFRELDREIVENSVTFRMAEVADQLRRRLDRDAIAAEIAASSGAGL